MLSFFSPLWMVLFFLLKFSAHPSPSSPWAVALSIMNTTQSPSRSAYQLEVHQKMPPSASSNLCLFNSSMAVETWSTSLRVSMQRLFSAESFPFISRTSATSSLPAAAIVLCSAVHPRCWLFLLAAGSAWRPCRCCQHRPPCSDVGKGTGGCWYPSPPSPGGRHSWSYLGLATLDSGRLILAFVIVEFCVSFVR